MGCSTTAVAIIDDKTILGMHVTVSVMTSGGHVRLEVVYKVTLPLPRRNNHGPREGLSARNPELADIGITNR
jgi:hypothetical protein